MIDLVDADGRKADRGGDLAAKQRCGGVAVVRVDELLGDDAVAIEGVAVGVMGGGLAGVLRVREEVVLVWQRYSKGYVIQNDSSGRKYVPIQHTDGRCGKGILGQASLARRASY